MSDHIYICSNISPEAIQRVSTGLISTFSSKPGLKKSFSFDRDKKLFIR